MNELRGKAVLVTGAGSGIGRATSLAFASAGSKLVVCDVDEERLAGIRGELETRGALILAERVDVSKRAEMEAFAARVHEKIPAVDVLVNNAGVGLNASVLDTTLDDWEWMLSINLWGAIHGIHFFVPKMVQRGEGGQVINVASGLGLVAAPDLAAYTTAKFGVVGLSEAARYDLEPHGIGVTAICPGIINTSILARSRIRGPAPEETRERAARLFARRNYPPEKVGRAIVSAARRNPAIQPVTPEAHLIWWLKRYLPFLLPPIVRAVPR
jgi:NAD(P)-dependent dehydrogenase (short-subunit alcohol dehydrogenase family)